MTLAAIDWGGIACLALFLVVVIGGIWAGRDSDNANTRAGDSTGHRNTTEGGGGL